MSAGGQILATLASQRGKGGDFMDADNMMHRFNVKEYHQLALSGALLEDARVELIEGRIMDMTPTGSKHAACINRLANELFPILHGRAILSIQNPIQLSDNAQPEPDIAILRFREDFYRDNHPRAEDVLMIIEVADTSLEYDRRIKNPLYAEQESLKPG